MNRRQFVALTVLLTLAIAKPGCPQPPEDQTEKNVYADLTRWFTAMFLPLDQLADTIDKTRLLKYLTRLGNSFEAMLDDKREIADLLTQRPIPSKEVEEIAGRLDVNVRLASERVTRVAFQLKGQYKGQGERIASALSDTIREKRSWLHVMASINNGSEDELRAFSGRATASATALEEANRELTKLVEFMRTQAPGDAPKRLTEN
jgi:hypothetical protein